MSHVVEHERNRVVRWLFWGFIFLVFAVLFNVMTAGEAAHIVLVVLGGIWQFLVTVWQIGSQAIAEYKANH